MDTLTALRTRALRLLGAAWHNLTRPTGGHAPLLGGSRFRLVRAAPYVVALAFTAALLPSGIALLHDAFALSLPVAAALAVAQVAALPLAVTRPLAAWWVVTAAAFATAVVTAHQPRHGGSWPWPVTAILAYLVVMLALALRESRSALLTVWGATVALSVAVTVLGQRGTGDAGTVLLIALSGAVLLLGWSIRDRGEARRALAAQEQISEAERARRALLEERARIARELHDVVAHHMSVIAVQADSAPYRLAGVPAEAAAEFGSIADAARESLTEMRRLLGVLRSEEAAGDRAPQPGLAQLAGLVETVAQAGVRAELSVEPGTGEPPSAVGLSAYRIVQESLANVVRHAPGAQAWVSIASDGAELRVTVVNSASPRPGRAVEAADGTGHGLVGMRERVRLLGGSLDTGPLAEGGYRVAAVLPLAPAKESAL